MAKILQFTQRSFTKNRPSKSELASAFERIQENRWPWEYVVDIFLRRTGNIITETQLRKIIYNHFPMSETNDDSDNNTLAYETRIYTQKETDIEIIEERKASFGGRWELRLNMPSLLEEDFSFDRKKMVAFVESLPLGVEYKVWSGWHFVGTQKQLVRPRI